MKNLLQMTGIPLCFLACSLNSCSVIDPAEEIPSYIRIDSIGLTSTSLQGTASHKITDAWIYIDGKLLGGFELPCNVPVLAEGAHTILIKAGIHQDGLSGMRAIYPFYQGWESTVQLSRGTSVALTPVVNYFPAIVPTWHCYFSQQGTNIDDETGAPFPNILNDVTGADAFEGTSAGVILTDTINVFYARSSDSFVGNGGELYLEMNYKCNQSFTVGVRDPQSGREQRWVEVLPSATWNKIYIRLNDAVALLPVGSFEVYFMMQKHPDLTRGELFVDNIKLMN